VEESSKHGRSVYETDATYSKRFITLIKANGSRESAVNTAAGHSG